ncbi:MAG: hypothetical protein ABIF82_05335 [Planctomycetota bacterium]
MVLTRRERYIFIGTFLALGVLALDRLALSPLLEHRSAIEAQRASLSAELARARTLMAHRSEMDPRWREMVRAGMKSDPAEAESQVLHAIRDWAEEAGLVLLLLKPDRLTEKPRLPEIVFQAAGTGNMRGVVRLLWRIQTAAIPVKATEMQISARKDGLDDLSFQLRISTVYAPSPAAIVAAANPRPDTSGGP